ncbi:MAG: hypothetical protein AAF220_04540 [Pseudomonadota bacterium]
MINKSTVLWLSVMVIAGFGLLQLKYRVHALEDELAAVNRSIEEHQETAQVLRAEWSYLNEPSRIERLSREHLGLQPVSTDQIGTIQQVPLRVPPEPLHLPNVNDPVLLEIAVPAAPVPAGPGALPALRSASVDPGSLLPSDMTVAPVATAPSLASLPATQ